MATKCLSGTPYISGASVWNLFHVTTLAPRVLRWLLDLWNFVYLCSSSKIFLTVDYKSSSFVSEFIIGYSD